MANIPGTLNQAVNPQTFAPNLNITNGGVYNLTLNPGSVVANGTGTLPRPATGLGLQVNDFVRVSFQGTQTAGIFIADAWVSAPDTLQVTFGNVSGAAATPVNGVYDVLVLRPSSNISQVSPAIQP